MSMPQAESGGRDLDVVIVNFRTPQLTIRCIQSIIACGIATLERVVVVDNLSGDDSPDTIRAAIPEVRLFETGENAGFGAGVNAGFTQGSGAFVLVLNPDTYFERDTVADVLALMQAEPGTGVVGLDLVNPDGSRQYSARRFYSLMDIAARRSSLLGRLLAGRVDHHLMKEHWKGRAPFHAEWVMGTGFVIRRTVFDAIGGMDPDYFLYLEDVDLCARVWEAGYQIRCLPEAQLVHDHQRSSAASPLSFAGKTHLKSLLRFARKFGVPIFHPPGVPGIVGAKRGRSGRRRAQRARI